MVDVWRKTKTYKRETAALLLAAYAGGCGYALYAMAAVPDANHDGMVSLLSWLGVPVMGFAAGAFGLDCLAKQIKGGRQ